MATNFSGQVEISRWVFIDKQIYGLMSVFGNGVISGWTVAAEESFTISISEGYGNVNFIAARTTFPDSIEEIPPNSVRYIYAKVKERTTFAEDIEFVSLPTGNMGDPHFLLLAEVTSGPASIEAVDNSVRQEIGFLELIKAAICLHKHRGGSLYPSKIDLTSEVKGQLPSFRIADFDAEKVTTGTFDLERMPIIDHQELSNVGLLTHPQLDTFVKTLEVSNKEIFGEIGTSNLLQLVLAMKLIYEDPDSAFYMANQTVDENMINEFAVIPGITPNDYIDFDNTTAEIHLDQHYIKGVPPTTGTSYYVNYDTALAWNSAYSLQNLIIVGSSVTLAFNDDDEANIVTIEGFESAQEPGQVLSNSSEGGQELFKREIVLISDNAEITANASSTNVIEGFYSGKFKNQESFRNQFVKEFTEPQNWSTYDSFVIHIKCLDSIHGAVKLYFVDNSGNQSTEYVLLDANEITSNTDEAAYNFEMRVISLATIPFRNDIKKFVIFTDDLENPFSFYVDDINIQRAVLLPEEGLLKLRYSSSNTIIFSYIEWTSIELSGSEIQVRARAANGTAFLTRAEFTPYLNNAEPINLEGTDIEIEVMFTPDDARLISPILQSLRVLILTEAEIDGYQINTVEEFARGDTENIEITTSPVSLELGTPIYVDSYYFCLGNTINQIHEETSIGIEGTFSQGELAVMATKSPIAPNQIFKAIEDGESRVTMSRFFEPRSVRRQVGRTFVVADTYNDRVLEYNENGDLISGVGSINYEHSDKVFPVSVAFDIRTGILYVVWSKKISFKTVNVGGSAGTSGTEAVGIRIQTATQQIQLIKDFDKIMGLTTSELDTVDAEGQIMPIHLSDQNAGIVQQLVNTDTYLLISSNTLSSGMDTDSIFYKAISTSLGIPMFVGNFAYIDGIFTPTFANKTNEDGFIIANATVAVKDYEFPDTVNETISHNTNISNIIEIDSNNNVVFGTNTIQFSPFIPGRAEKVDSNTLLLGGLRPDGEEGTPDNDHPFDFRSLSGSDEAKQKQKETLQQIFFTSNNPFVGAVVVLDVRAMSTTFEYVSAEGMLVSDVDVDTAAGEYIVAESSLDKSGRIIKLDATGNIVFSFGEGLYNLINGVSYQIDGSMVIST